MDGPLLAPPAARAAGGASKGTSIGFRFLVHLRLCTRDPLTVATTQAIQSLVSVRCSKAVSNEALVSCFEDGARVSTMASPWGATKQPVAALMLSLRRINWALKYERGETQSPLLQDLDQADLRDYKRIQTQ